MSELHGSSSCWQNNLSHNTEEAKTTTEVLHLEKMLEKEKQTPNPRHYCRETRFVPAKTLGKRMQLPQNHAHSLKRDELREVRREEEGHRKRKRRKEKEMNSRRELNGKMRKQTDLNSTNKGTRNRWAKGKKKTP